MTEIDTRFVADAYLKWLKEGVSTQLLDESVTELTTPFLDHHNDFLQVYAEKMSTGLFLLTDDGYIISELRSSGVDHQGPRRKLLIDEILAGHGVQLKGNELQVQSDVEHVGSRIHSLVQAMINVDDLFVLAQKRVSSLFYDDVSSFLDQHEVRYTPRVKFAGRSGLDHLVDFVIPQSKEAPERVLSVVNSPRRDRIESLLFGITDSRAARPRQSKYLALLNDKRQVVGPEVLAAFSSYDVQASSWSGREEIAEALVA